MKIRHYISKLSSFYKSQASILLTYIFCCLFIIFVYLLTENTDISMYELVADPNEVGQTAPYTGLVSTIGTMIFGAIVTACFFSAYLIGTVKSEVRRWGSFLKFSGYLMLIFLIDDLWQIHENIPTLFFGSNPDSRLLQNIGETIVFIFLGIIFFGYLVRFRKLIYQTKLFALVLAIAFLGISTVVDIFLANISGHFILEEGFKLLGIVSLAIYYFQTCSQKIRQFSVYLNDRPQLEQDTRQQLSKLK